MYGQSRVYVKHDARASCSDKFRVLLWGHAWAFAITPSHHEEALKERTELQLLVTSPRQYQWPLHKQPGGLGLFNTIGIAILELLDVTGLFLLTVV